MRKNPIEEARLRANKARMILEERGILDVETEHYENQKAVRKAGRVLWHAVLIALDTVFDIREDRRTKVYINDYLKATAKKDERFAILVDDGFSVISVYMAFDGIQHKPICDEGFRLANDIIEHCDRMLAKA